MKKIFTLFLLSIIAHATYSQQNAVEKELSQEGKIIFLKYNDDKLKRPLAEAARLLADSLRIGNSNSLLLRETHKDKLGFTHQYYHQYYKGLKVEYGIYAVHAKNDKIEYISGTFKDIGNVNVTPKLSPEEALDKALKLINANTYKWENAQEEKLLKEITGKSDTTYYPKGELLIIEDILQGNRQYRLAYKFNIYAEKPLSRKIYYIDAINGSLLYAEQLIKHANAPGTAQTRYSGTQSITTDSFASGFRLQEVRNGVNIRTFNMNRTAIYGTTDFVDNDNNWTSNEHANSNMDNAALDAHWGAERVFDYFLNTHSRNSWNGSGSILLNYVHANLINMGYSNNDNAFWDGQRMTYGDGTTMFTPLTSLDVVAHEIGHGVMQSSANLSYSGESGALNEGFSDIWAACVEAQAAPTKQRWLIGEEITRPGQSAAFLRSMQNPNAGLFPQPDTYGGTFWDANGSVHINSGVLNFWFFLLVQGGNGTNDIGSNYSVTGIGIDNAASVAYRAMAVHLTSFPQATFSIARTQTIQAAIDLFGANSCQHIAVVNAWHAVGVGASWQSNITISGPANFCSGDGIYEVAGVPAGSVTWSVSGDLIIDGSNTANPVTVSPGFIGGEGVLTATINYCGTPTTKTKPILSGTLSGKTGDMYWEFDYFPKREFNHYDFTSRTLCLGESWYINPQYTDAYGNNFSNNPNSGITFEILPSNSNSYTVAITNHNSFIISFNTYGNIQIPVRILNQCGDGEIFYVYVNVAGYYCWPYNYTVSPNPADEELIITYHEDTNETKTFGTTTGSGQAKLFEVSMYNDKGKLMRKAKNTDKAKDLVLNTRTLPNGTYILHINDGKEIIKKHIIVKHK